MEIQDIKEEFMSAFTLRTIVLGLLCFFAVPHANSQFGTGQASIGVPPGRPDVLLLPLLAAQQSGQIRVLKVTDGKLFQMGGVKASRVVHPDMGAKKLTLNFTNSEPGAEFSQHVHDYSDDTFLVLAGKVDVRQGDSRKPLFEGQAAFVPSGQIHGTVTTGTGTTMISFQCPPDLALYTGARDSSRPGAAPPKGVITPGAVKLIDFSKTSGFFTSPAMGSKRAAAAYRKLQPGQTFSTRVEGDGEQMLFVWKGEISVKSKQRTYKAGERETVFFLGPNAVEVRNDSSAESVVIQVQAPPNSEFAAETGKP